MFGRGTPNQTADGRPDAESEKRAAKAQAEAEKSAAKAQAEAEREAAIASGAWWMAPDAFRAFGRLRQFTIGKCAYLGGWPEHPKAHGNEKTSNSLVVDDKGLRYRGLTTIFAIPWEQVTGMEIEGPEQASKRISGARVAMIGIFALAAKKKVKSAVITVVTKDGDEAVFQTHDWLALDLHAKLTPVLGQLHKHQPAEPTAAAAPSDADQIRKLAELRDQGILTEAEFQAKKTELLARI
jgi:hypothetical protein